MKIPVHPSGVMSTFEFDFDSLPQNLSGLDENLTWILNASRDVESDLIEKFTSNRNLDGPAFWILIFLYSVLIIFGATGNSLVVIAVARKQAMRTARNMFIVNLAVSDLLLCLVTTPLTLMEILSKHWPLGRQALICKLIGTLQATSIFVSTISITAIALDRYQVIVYPTRENLQVMGAVFILTVIWTLAIILASPMFIYRTLKTHTINLFGIDTVSFCMEEWPIKHGRAYYSAFSLVVQYLLPIIVVSAAYLRIYFKLKYRYVSTQLTGEVKKVGERGRRMQRTNSLLISIAVIYCISWLPLNLFNLFADLSDEPVMDHQWLLIFYAVCHMMGMSSACSNPLLYGWLNDNFKKEFREILACGRIVRAGRSMRSPGRKQQTENTPGGVRLNAMSRKGSDMQDMTDNGMHMTVADTEMTILAR